MYPMNGGQLKKIPSQWHISWTAPLSQFNLEDITRRIDSGAGISLPRYSTYQHTDSSFKTPKQLTTAELNTTDGLPITALGMTALHLRIADFKFTYNFIICDRLPDSEIIFGIDVQKKLSI